MKRALALAAKARGQTNPNPLVGAVIVKNGKIVGEGYHVQAGAPHAEIVALERAREQAQGATLYINLEPCCHYGRTPPCTRAIIESGIKKVIISMLDPNPLVAGKGREELLGAGIQLEVGLLAEEAQRLNEVFIKYITTRRPFVILKAGISLDGKIATSTGQSRWITGSKARYLSHQLRREADAILVGKRTILVDDPLLTVRLPQPSAKNPIKVVVDSTLEIPTSAKILSPESPAPTIIATTARATKEKMAQLEAKGARIITLSEREGRVDLGELMDILAQEGISSLILEGGAELNAAALQAGIVDKVVFFMAPIIIGGSTAPNVVGGKGFPELKRALRLTDLRLKKVGRDYMLEGYLKPSYDLLFKKLSKGLIN